MTTSANDAKKAARPIGLKALIFSMTMAASLIPLGMYGAATYQTTTEEATQFATESLLKSNRSSAKLVSNWIDAYEQSVKALANSESLRSMDPARIKAELVPYNKELPKFYAMMAINPAGQQIARSDNEKLIYVGDRDYVKKVMEGSPSYIQAGISRINNKPFLGFSAPIKTGDSVVGVMAALGTIENFADQVTGGKIGKTGYSYLVDKSAMTIMAHPDPAMISKKLTEGQIRRLNQSSQEVLMSDTTDEGVAIRYTTSAVGNRMALISEMPEAEIQEPINMAQRTAAIFAVVAVLLSGGLGFFMANNLSRKMTRLTALIAGISRAKSAQEITTLESHLASVGGARELHQIAAAIRRLATSIKLAMTT